MVESLQKKRIKTAALCMPKIQEKLFSLSFFFVINEKKKIERNRYLVQRFNSRYEVGSHDILTRNNLRRDQRIRGIALYGNIP